MSSSKCEKPKAKPGPSRELETAMAAASAAMKDAGEAYAVAGLDRSARFSLAQGAMQETEKLAQQAVKTAMAQVDEAMDQLPHSKRARR